MASSVIMADPCISIFLWKLHSVATTLPIAYVDDLNVVTYSRHDLELVLRLLFEFVHDFRLSISLEKSYLWGSSLGELGEVGLAWGLTAPDVFNTLGMEWGLTPTSKPEYQKELLRVDTAKERLCRLTYLPLAIHEKAKIASVGCLSLLDYSPRPQVQHVEELRTCVKKKHWGRTGLLRKSCSLSLLLRFLTH